MALSCLLTKITTHNYIFRGTGFRTSRNIFLKTITPFATGEPYQFRKSELFRDQLPKNGTKLALIPPSFYASNIRFASQSTTEPAYKKHSHVMTWRLERILSAALLPVIPAALIVPSQALDTVVAVMIVLHTFWGLEAIVVDYIRPIIFGNVIPKIALGLLYLFSAAMLGGLLNLIYNDSGLANTILQILKS